MNGQFEIGDLPPEKLFIGLSAILGLLFALIAESQTNSLIHFLHWQIQTTGAVLVILSVHLALFSGSEWLATRPWLKVVISGVLGAVIFSPLTLLSDIHLGGEILEGTFRVALVDEMLAIIPPITIAWMAINSPWLMGYRLKRPAESTINKSTQAEPEFLSQTELSTARDILYIKSELHYLNVVTLDSKQLILNSLKETSSQLDAAGIQGIRCHRGYWVANSAIESAQRAGRQAVLKLINGESVPVSRTNVENCIRSFG